MWNDCLDAGPTGKLLVAYIVKKELCDLCATAKTGGHRHEISQRLYQFFRGCADADIPEATTLATTIETWQPAVLAFLTTGVTNDLASHCTSC
jgi:transposase